MMKQDVLEKAEMILVESPRNFLSGTNRSVIVLEQKLIKPTLLITCN